MFDVSCVFVSLVMDVSVYVYCLVILLKMLMYVLMYVLSHRCMFNSHVYDIDSCFLKMTVLI